MKWNDSYQNHYTKCLEPPAIQPTNYKSVLESRGEFTAMDGRVDEMERMDTALFASGRARRGNMGGVLRGIAGVYLDGGATQ